MSSEISPTAAVSSDLPPRTWRQWWSDLPGYWRIAGRSVAVLAGIQAAIMVWMIPGYFESEQVRKLRRQGAVVVYDWQRESRRFPNPVVERWIAPLKIGFYGQSPRRVTDIALRDVFTDNSVLEGIGRNFPNLRWLRINDPNNRVSLDGLRAVQNCRHLEGLWIYGHSIDDDFLKIIASFRGLKHLSFINSVVTAKDLSPLHSLKVLQGLYLGGSLVTDQQLDPISELTTLVGLDVSGTLVTDKSLAVFQQLPKLQYVRLEYTDTTLLAIQKWRGVMTAGLPKVPTDLELPGTGVAIRWSDGRMSGNFQPQLPLFITGPLVADNAEIESGAVLSLLRSPVIGPLEAAILTLADGTYQVIAMHGDVESEPASITVQGRNAPDGRVEIRMPALRPQMPMHLPYH